MAKAEKQVTKQTKARKPAKGKRAKALQASTAAVKRAPVPTKRAKTTTLSRHRREEAAQRKEDKRIMFWVDLNEKGQRGLPAIVTMEELIVALGGPHAVGEWLYVNEPDRWLQFGYVTRGYCLQVYLALTTMGYRHINPNLFGVPSWGELLPPRMRMPASTEAVATGGFVHLRPWHQLPGPFSCRAQERQRTSDPSLTKGVLYPRRAPAQAHGAVLLFAFQPTSARRSWASTSRERNRNPDTQ